jgi:hypothetical protein
MHGLRTGHWSIMKTWFCVDVLMCQLVPMICFVVLLAADPVTCDTHFCARSFFLGWIDGVAVLFSVAAAWDYFGSFVVRLVVFAGSQSAGK